MKKLFFLAVIVLSFTGVKAQCVDDPENTLSVVNAYIRHAIKMNDSSFYFKRLSDSLLTEVDNCTKAGNSLNGVKLLSLCGEALEQAIIYKKKVVSDIKQANLIMSIYNARKNFD